MIQHNITDTIVAIATPPGRGGIGVIRISGKLVTTIASKLLKKVPKPRYAQYTSFLTQEGYILEKVIAIFFPGPHSFTGENVLEIQGHGGRIILDLLLEQILKTSTAIRIANPGEFTERAFLNGKIDLIQAEAVTDIIDAASHQAAQSASNSLQGMFSKKINIIIEKIIKLRTQIESLIDFPEETNNIISWCDIKKDLHNIINDIMKVYQSAQHGILLREGINIVIAGKPNSGKSSLFNRLIDMNRAIVSTIAGTTRDTLHETIQLNGINLNITDTAGLQKKSNNEVEKIGMQKTKEKIKQADHILWVVDSNNYDYSNMLYSIKNICLLHNNKKIPITIIKNKSDLSLEKIGINKIQEYTCITLSALLNDGINLLKQHLLENTVLRNKIKKEKNTTYVDNIIYEHQSNFIARRRHLHSLEKSSQYLLSAKTTLQTNPYNNTINEIFAEDLKLAQYELNEILGQHQSMSEDLLEKIFSQFCIGK